MQFSKVYSFTNLILSADMLDYYLTNPQIFGHLKDLFTEVIVAIGKIPRMKDQIVFKECVYNDLTGKAIKFVDFDAIRLNNIPVEVLTFGYTEEFTFDPDSNSCVGLKIKHKEMEFNFDDAGREGKISL
jgi:hypothetical protein